MLEWLQLIGLILLGVVAGNFIRRKMGGEGVEALEIREAGRRPTMMIKRNR